MLTNAVPVLPALNISESIGFYETRLGFKGINYGNYAILKYKNVEIHLSLITGKVNHSTCGCLVWVENIQDLFTIFCVKGLIGTQGKLIEKLRGIKEFTIKDNNNNSIRFAEKS